VVSLIDNWNTDSCALTGRAVFSLGAPAQIVNVELWYNWQQGETSVPFELRTRNKVISRGNLQRTSCDPHQIAWCGASTLLTTIVPAGQFTIDVAHPRVCRNRASNNNGFIRVRGMQ
jgi:hypothetical protein